MNKELKKFMETHSKHLQKTIEILERYNLSYEDALKYVKKNYDENYNYLTTREKMDENNLLGCLDEAFDSLCYVYKIDTNELQDELLESEYDKFVNNLVQIDLV